MPDANEGLGAGPLERQQPATAPLISLAEKVKPMNEAVPLYSFTGVVVNVPLNVDGELSPAFHFMAMVPQPPVQVPESLYLSAVKVPLDEKVSCSQKLRSPLTTNDQIAPG